MKKIFMALFLVIAVAVPCNAASYNSATRVQTVGEQLLTKNGIPASNIKFTVVSDSPNNSNFISTKVINVSSAELAFAGNDNETAAVVAHEIGHIILGHSARGKVMSLLQENAGAEVTTSAQVQTFAQNYQTTKEDKEADLVAVNLMVNAGYNPLAAIVVYTKQTGTYWDTIVGRHANAEKALNIYDYIAYFYPAKLKAGYGCNEFRTFQEYAKGQIESRKSIKKLEQKNLKNYQKAQKKTANSITKFKTRGGISGWDAVYGLLNAQ